MIAFETIDSNEQKSIEATDENAFKDEKTNTAGYQYYLLVVY